MPLPVHDTYTHMAWCSCLCGVSPKCPSRPPSPYVSSSSSSLPHASSPLPATTFSGCRSGRQVRCKSRRKKTQPSQGGAFRMYLLPLWHGVRRIVGSAKIGIFKIWGEELWCFLFTQRRIQRCMSVRVCAYVHGGWVGWRVLAWHLVGKLPSWCL